MTVQRGWPRIVVILALLVVVPGAQGSDRELSANVRVQDPSRAGGVTIAVYLSDATGNYKSTIVPPRPLDAGPGLKWPADKGRYYVLQAVLPGMDGQRPQIKKSQVITTEKPLTDPFVVAFDPPSEAKSDTGKSERKPETTEKKAPPPPPQPPLTKTGAEAGAAPTGQVIGQSSAQPSRPSSGEDAKGQSPNVNGYGMVVGIIGVVALAMAHLALTGWIAYQAAERGVAGFYEHRIGPRLIAIQALVEALSTSTGGGREEAEFDRRLTRLAEGIAARVDSAVTGDRDERLRALRDVVRETATVVFREAVTALPPGGAPERETRPDAAGEFGTRIPYSQTSAGDAGLADRSRKRGDGLHASSQFVEAAARNYKAMLGGDRVTAATVNLELDGERSHQGADLGHEALILRETRESAAPFIAFQDAADHIGLLYPSATVEYTESMNAVFHEIRRENASITKQTVTPRLVRQIEVGLWEVRDDTVA